MRLSALVLRAALLGGSAFALAGCLAASVAGAAVGAAGTAVGVTAKAASETVHVGHMAVNAATGGGDRGQDGGR
jgi:hypothetical protein